MEIDLNIFNYFYALRNKKREKKIQNVLEKFHAAKLEDFKNSLSVFSSGIFKIDIEIRASEEIPYKSSNVIFLPPFISITENHDLNEMAYNLIILHLLAYDKIDEYAKNKDEGLRKDFIRNYLNEIFPKYLEILNSIESNLIEFNQEEIEVLSKSKSKIGFNKNIVWGSKPRNRQIIHTTDAKADEVQYPDVKTEKKNKLSGKINKVNLNEDEENIGQDVFHHFEKIETIEEYKGINRETDGEDQLDDHLEALSDINLEEVVRSSKRVQSLYKTEVDLGFEVADVELVEVNNFNQKFLYDEWDSGKRQYRKEWCTVYHSKLETQQGTNVVSTVLKKVEQRRNEINRIKKRLLQLSAEIEVKKKLLDGRSIDIDNFVRNQSDIRATGNGDGRYYKNIIKRHRDMSILVLVDCSLSSDSWVNNHRVLDICIESLLIFGEAVSVLDDPLMVAGFNSNTRNSCKFIEWKGFAESWQSLKSKISDIRPDGFTRIGPAIRHGKSILEKRNEKHKMLIILTDGRPTDYDRYEGVYGLGDVKKAISECESIGIVPFALAVDPSSKQFLPHLFGQNNYQILHSVEKLPETLTKLYIRISKAVK